jgi:hypothetical protein
MRRPPGEIPGLAHLPNVVERLRIAADLHGSVLRAVAHGDESEAVAASHRLNDYLVDLTYRALGGPATSRTAG